MQLPASVFLLSASALAYEIIVIRILALTHWQPFVTLSVSTALLGFGLAGSLLMWFGGKAFENRRTIYPLASLLAAISFRPAVWAAAALHLEPGLIFRDLSQWILLSGLVAVLTVPFFLISFCLALPLLEQSTVGKYYGWNLAGACAGVVFALAGMAVFPPERLALIPTGTAALGSLLALNHYRLKRALLWIMTMGFAAILAMPSDALKYGPYKDISYSILLPEASVMARSWGPGGLLEVMSAPSLRAAPGLSTRYKGLVPRQAVLYRDGDRLGILTLPAAEGPSPEYPLWQTAAAPYFLFTKIGKVAVLGFEGGEEVMRANMGGAHVVDVVEADRSVVILFKKIKSLYGGRAEVQNRGNLVVDNPRHYLTTSGRNTDIVVVPLSENLASSVAGFGAASEDYLLTLEGIAAALQILNPKGLLAITGWNQSPPTGRLKLLNTIRELPDFSEASDLDEKVRIVVGWSTYTVLVSREKLGGERLQSLRKFCQRCGFDLLAPEKIGGNSGDLPLTGNGEATAGLDLGSVTDAKPYPWHTLKTGLMLKAMGRSKEAILPRMEWGFLFLSMTLVVTLVVAACVLSLTRPRLAGIASLPSLLYFTCLGVGYMVVEILVIKRGGLLIAQPERATAFVLAPFLLFSGLGSFNVRKVENWWLKGRWVYIGIATATVILYLLIPVLIPLSEPLRILLLVFLICPLAILMGLPFPLGLRTGKRWREVSVPWAWAITGYTSAAGSALAGVLSVTEGHIGLLVVAVCCYLAAGMFLGWMRTERTTFDV